MPTHGSSQTARSLSLSISLSLSLALAISFPLGVALAAGTGCSNGSGAPVDGVDVDAGGEGDPIGDGDGSVTTMDAGEDGVVDLGLGDAGPTTVAVTGWVLGVDATERDLDASPSGFDGGLPEGAAATPGGRIYGANVVLRDALTGAELARTLTDSRGFYSLRGPSGTIVLQEVEPVGAYLGVIRAEEVRPTDYEAYDIYLPLRDGAQAIATEIGVAYDRTHGVVACGFNPVTPDLGGEGAELGESVSHAPAVNLAPEAVIVTNVLPPRCSALDGGTVAFEGGPPCTTLERSLQIHFLDTQLGFAPVTAISPPGGTCTVRYGLAAWLVRPDTYTVVNIDCM